MEPLYTDKPEMRVKLIFNPGSGIGSESPDQLLNIIKEMQAWRLAPETYLIEPGCDLREAVTEAAGQGIKLIVACGGDGTVSSVARELAGTDITMGIIPTGTQNNIAHSLSIPGEIPAAIALLRTGKRKKIDMGRVICGNNKMPFLEICSVGLFSSLFQAGDDIQHGNLLKIGDFFAALTAAPPAEIRLTLDGETQIQKSGHVLLICNMPYVLRRYQVGTKACYKDGLLDVLFYAGLSKMDLVGCVLNKTGKTKDPRIRHYRVSSAEIETAPPMPVMADGLPLDEGCIRVEAMERALTVMTPRFLSKLSPKSGAENA